MRGKRLRILVKVTAPTGKKPQGGTKKKLETTKIGRLVTELPAVYSGAISIF